MKIDTPNQLIQRIRSEPGKLNAAASNGISEFLLYEFIKQNDLAVAQGPYRDIMQAPTGLVGGRIQVLATSLAVVQPLAEAGQIKVLLVTSNQRSSTMPNVPTASKSGYPDLTF